MMFPPSFRGLWAARAPQNSYEKIYKLKIVGGWVGEGGGFSNGARGWGKKK